MYNLAKTDKTKLKIKIIMKLIFNLIEQLRKRLPPAASSASPPSHQSKKLIHFLTHEERPDFDGPKIARNCPKIIFAFDRNFQNSKIKLKNDPLK